MSVDDYLSKAADAAKRGVPVEIAVPDLLGLWGYRVRSHAAVEDVLSALDSYDLRPEPSLDDARAGQPVRLVTAQQTPPPPQVDEVTEGPADEDMPLQVSMRVGTLPSATGGVLSVSLDDTLEHAESKMLSNEYSQLAVIHEGDRRGAVTWESIAAARVRGEATLRAALEPRPEVVHVEDDLLRQVDRIWAAGFALVERDGHELCGIVTHADLANQFVNFANPFVLLSEIERRLRRFITANCTVEQMKRKARYKKRVHGADDLMFGDYMEIFRDPGLWGQCGWNLDQQVFVTKLGEVKDIRNEVMHFRPEPLAAVKITCLQQFLTFANRLDGNL